MMRYLYYLARYNLVRPSVYRWLLAVLILLGITAVLSEAPFWLLLLILLLLLLLILFRRQIYPNFYPEEEYLVQNQVIVIGPRDFIDNLPEAAKSQAGLELTELPDRLIFDGLPEEIIACLNKCYEFASADLVLTRFEIQGDRPDVARTIRILRQLAGSGSQIRVEPNWITGSPWDVGGSPWDVGGSPWDVGGSPWDVGGSPWDVGGSPWDVGGSPWDVGGSSTGDKMKPADPEHFAIQWAFKTIELDGRGALNGENVRIGIFDTSPFPDRPQEQNRPDNITVEALRPTQELDLELSRHIASAKLASAIPQEKRLSVENHGLFVAGIIDAIAGQANLRLYRVLGPDNRGDLFLLLHELFSFLLETAAANPRPATIINLSLGVRIPPDWVGVRLPKQVESLQLMMQLANCLGVTVVAASGNHSAQLDQPEGANLPALWPQVIGVAASNKDNRRACFSNQGDIAAPGGDGGPVKREGILPILRRGFRLVSGPLRRRGEIVDACQPTLEGCLDENCEYGLIGPVLNPVKRDDGPASNYIYWHGTSFAAPIVTGLAALVQQRGQGRLTPAQVRRIIECGAMPAANDNAALGAGIVNVRQTMERFIDCARELGIDVDEDPEPQDEYAPDESTKEPSGPITEETTKKKSGDSPEKKAS